MAFATVDDLQERIIRTLSDRERQICAVLLEDATDIINAYNKDADDDAKTIVSINMVKRLIATSDNLPIGTTQGSMGALGYSQSFTLGSGASAGELYLTRLDKKMLKVSSRIGSRSPLERGLRCD